MLKRFVNKRRMMTAVLDFLQQNTAKLDGIPGLAALIATLSDLVTRIGNTHESQLVTSLGQTRKKEELKQKLIASTLAIIKRANAYALVENDPVLKHNLGYTATGLEEMPQNTLADAVNKVIATCNPVMEHIAPYGLTAAMLDTAAQDLAAYVAALPAARRVIATRKTATAGLNELFTQSDDALVKIDALMELAGSDDALLLQDYKNLRKIGDLKGKAAQPPQTPPLPPNP